ncbi:carboxypeptidase regulatory-like domain-containing protein [Vibrio kyushuensis]|uniref:carboxypeptidase regulatory-like domain-containing protein n=1 Tax=Vibrio kyushuensis TaxID=2910249 RepID=UPI003D0E53A5
MNISKRLYYIYILLFSVIITGCNGGSDGDNSGVSSNSGRTGTLDIILQDETNASQFKSDSTHSTLLNRSNKQNTTTFSDSNISNYNTELSPYSHTTNEPTLDLEADSFLVQGSGPDGETFEFATNDRGARSVQGLAIGPWNVTVTARDKNGNEFARGQKTMTVNADQTTPSIVELTMEEGKGTFEFEVIWPKNIALSPTPTIELKNNDGEEVNGISIAVSDYDADNYVTRFSLDNSIDSGYYALVFTIHDGNNSDAKVHLSSGFAETIRIIAGQPTVVNQTLKGVKGIGSIDLGIELNLNNKLPINIANPDSHPTQFAYDSGTEFTVTADVPEGDDSYGNIIRTWYLNGQLVEFGSSFTVNTATSPLTTTFNGKYISGHYRLDVVAFNLLGERSGSASYEFEVTGDQTIVVEQGSLTGFVKYKHTNSPINDYLVTLTNEQGNELHYDASNFGNQDTGEFKIEAIPSGKYTLEVSRNGYLSFIEQVQIASNRSTNKEIIRLFIADYSTVNGTSGGIITSDIDYPKKTATIEFPNNAFVLEDGSLYTGNVQVAHIALNPSDSSFLDAFPGGFTGITIDDQGDPQEVDIISFGVIAAQLSDGSGNLIKLANDKKATIRMSIANPDTAPLTLPLWHLDESTGQWVEDGVATLIDGQYVGEVSHFSWWNFDYSCGVITSSYCPWIRVTFDVVDIEGNAVPYANIHLQGEGNFAYGKTVTADHLGRITTKVPFSPTATQEQWESISYTVSAEQSQSDLDINNRLSSKPSSMQFYLEHTEGKAGYGKAYSRTIVLDGSQAYLTVKAEINNQLRGVEHNGSSVKVSKNSIPTVLKVKNKGSQLLNIDSIKVINNDGSTATNWQVTPPQMVLAQNDENPVSVTYTGSNWAQDRAKVKFISNDASGETLIPLITVLDSTQIIQESITLSTLQTHDGQMGYCWTITDPYGDPYAPSSGEEQACIHSYSYYERNPTFTGENTRGYFAFDLSAVPQGALITSAKLVHKSWSNADAHIYLGNQNETLTVEGVYTTFDSACVRADEDCLLSTIPTSQSGSEGALTQNGLNALNNAVMGSTILKLLAMNNESTVHSSLRLDQLELVVEFAH